MTRAVDNRPEPICLSHLYSRGSFFKFPSSESHKSLRKGDLADHCPFVLPGGSGRLETILTLLITEPLGCRVESPAFRGALRVPSFLS